MGARLLVVFAMVATGCSTESIEDGGDHADAEPPRVPNPPPRYESTTTNAPVDGGQRALVVPGEPLMIKCGGRQPFVCVVDGAPVCSDRPCVPDCTRVGCIGADVCTACDGGWVCRAPGEGC